MRMERGFRYAAIVGSLLLTVSSALAAGPTKPGGASLNAAVHVTAVLTEKAALQDCKDPTKVNRYHQKGKLAERWPVIQDPPPPEGFLRVEVRKGEQYCVKDYAVETDQPVALKAECGPVTSQRKAGTRNVGEGCEQQQQKKPKH